MVVKTPEIVALVANVAITSSASYPSTVHEVICSLFNIAWMRSQSSRNHSGTGGRFALYSGYKLCLKVGGAGSKVLIKYVGL